MNIVRALAIASLLFLPVMGYAQEVPPEIRESILARCRSQMEAIGGASMVRFCLNEDIAAYVVLQSYDDEWAGVIERCRRQMLSIGGWNIVKFCADEDIAAEKELRGE